MKKKLLLLFILFPILLFGITSSYDLDGAVGFWTLSENDASSTTIFDKFKNDGTSANTPVFTYDQNGVPNQSQTYNGSSDYVNISDSPYDFGTTDFSISAWVKFSALTSWQYVLSKSVSFNTAGYYIRLDDTSVPYFQMTGDVASTSVDFEEISIDEWNLYQVSVNRTTGDVLSYINGILKNTGSCTTDGDLSNAIQLCFGNVNQGSGTQRFTGDMSDAIVYSEAKSAEFFYSQYLAGQTTSGIVADGSNLVPNKDNSYFTTWGNVDWAVYSGDSVSDGGGKMLVDMDAVGESGCNLTSAYFGITVGNKYQVSFDVWQGTTTETAFTISSTGFINESFTISATQTKFTYEISSVTALNTLYLFTASPDDGTFYVDNFEIRDITNQQVSTLTQNLAFDMPMTVPNTRSGAELGINMDFSAWTGDDPDSWPIAFEDGTNYVTEHANGARFVTDGIGGITMSQAIMAEGRRYYVETSVSNHVSGGLKWRITDDNQTIITLNADGIYSAEVTSLTGGTISYKRSGASDMVINYCIIKEIDATTLDLSANANHGTVSGATVTYDGLVNAGAGIAYIPGEVAYGQWEWNFKKVTDASVMNMSFIASETTISGQEYSVRISATEEVELKKDSTILTESSASYITIDTDYRIKVTRTSAGIFTTYIKGGSFGWDDWTTVIAGGSGSNPVTSTTYTTSIYFTNDIDPADEISDLHINGKPISLSDATQSTGTWTPTKPSYYYDGTNTLTIPSSFNSTFAGDFTISCWLQPDDGQGANSFINGDYVDATGRNALQLRSGGELRYLFDANNDSEYITSDSAIFPNGATEWTHITITGDQSTAEIKMYIDGVLEATTVGTSISSANWALYNSTTNKYYFGDADNATGVYAGNEAHGRIWNELRSTTEIMQEYNRKKSIYQ